MIDSVAIKNHILALLDDYHVEYAVFEHAPILSYTEAEKAQKQYGWIGIEGKTLVLKVDNTFIIYFTLQGKKVNFDAVKNIRGVKKIRLATPEELQECFGAVPGCAYPFGFDEKFAIYVDPSVYEQEWVVFSPCLPTFTVQAKGSQLKKMFASLKNNVTETSEFNQ